MPGELVTKLLPVLSRSLDEQFNVFDVMHHGTHEKQLSNVFRWLLERGGSHALEDTFTRIFIDEVNRGLLNQPPFGVTDLYRVRQEVDTSNHGAPRDIADIVLESDAAVLVVENYYTSDGHGHDYDGYLQYGRRDGRDAAVVILCGQEDRNRLSRGWEQASVVTYEVLLQRLLATVEINARYKREHAEPYGFIEQLHRKFGRGGTHVSDRDVLDFVVALCDAGESGRYGQTNIDVVAEQFATDLADQARERFHEGRAILQRIKERLRSYVSQALAQQLREHFGTQFVEDVKINWSGSYKWAVVIHVDTGANELHQEHVALLIGPTAQYFWNRQDPDSINDYTRLSLYSERYRDGEKITDLRVSSVRLDEILDGLRPDDVRLRDEVVAAMDSPARAI